MRLPQLPSGHVGAEVSALVDGQLPPAEEERAWRHVLGCARCRRLVQQEGWVKRRLTGLDRPVSPPPSLVGSLYAVDAWAAVDALERRSNRRRAAALIAGAGTVGVAVAAFVTATAPPVGQGEVPGSPAMIGPSPQRDNPGTGLSTDVRNVALAGRSR